MASGRCRWHTSTSRLHLQYISDDHVVGGPSPDLNVGTYAWLSVLFRAVNFYVFAWACVMDVRTVQIIYSRILFRNLRFKGLSLSTGLLLRLLVRSTSMGWLLRNTGCGVWGTGNNKYIGSLVWTMLNSQMIWWILQAKHEIITRCMTDCWTILTDPAITVEIHESHFCHWHAQAWSH